MTTKKAKAPRVKKEQTGGKEKKAIQWFQDKAVEVEDKDVEKIRAAAGKQGYAASTISIQLGRLRAMGLLPAAPPKDPAITGEGGAEKKQNPKSKSVRANQTKKAKTFTPAPKPSQATAQRLD